MSIKKARDRYHLDQAVPQVAGLAPEVRDWLAKQSKWRMWKQPGVILFSVSPVIAAVVWVLVSPMVFPKAMLRQWPWEGVLPGLICITVFSSWYAVKRFRKRWVQAELVRLKIRPPYCVLCGYNLHGTPDASTSCPECGAAIAAITDDAAHENT